jgi:hypothetical protein
MKFAVAALLGAASAADLEIENSYLAYVAEHGKSYGTEEEFKFRMNLYSQRVEKVREHNANVTGNDATMGINHMADWTDAEYKRLLGFRNHPNANKATETFVGDVADLPASVDWRAKAAYRPKEPRTMWIMLGFLIYCCHGGSSFLENWKASQTLRATIC